jgi:cell division septation protein DedD
MDEFTPRENRGINGDFSAGQMNRPHKTLKEKNLYILHLDSPRIIILSCVMILLLVAVLLIGMNINKYTDKDKENFANDNGNNSGMIDNLLSGNKGNINPMENSIGSAPDENEELSAAINPLGDITKNNMQSAVPAENTLKNNITGNTNPAGAADTDDILTHENIESIIPPSNMKPASSASLKSAKEPVIKNSSKSRKSGKKAKRKSIVEVASKRENPDTSEVSGRGDYYSIQVASYDSNDKAQIEAKTLKDKKYDSFVDTTRLNGKKFYRVKIGPVYSMKEACSLLDEISEDERYENSYIVKK